MKGILRFIFPLLAAGAFLFSLFANIQYPLLWNDEGMTAMHAKRVLEFGYPKVSDGRNTVYDLVHSNRYLGRDFKSDAYIGGPAWGQYYLAAIPEHFASPLKDPYQKTLLLRAFFALLGCGGILLLLLACLPFLSGAQNKSFFLTAFFLLAALSVPFTLHLREVRYYSPALFLSGLLVFLWSKWNFASAKKNRIAWLGIFPSLIALLFVFPAPWMGMLLCFGLYDLFRRFAALKKGMGPELLYSWIKDNLHLIAAFAVFIPYVLYFDTFHITSELKAYNIKVGFYKGYLPNLIDCLHYYLLFEPFFAFLLLRALSVYFRRKSEPSALIALSDFISLIWLCLILTAAMAPNMIWIRYHLSAIPLLWIAMLLDLSCILPQLRQWLSGSKSTVAIMGITALIPLNVLLRLPYTAPWVRGHVTESLHPNKGPLDLVIPWIQEHFPQPERLKIATNYEESCLMYYLGSQVTIGFLQAEFVRDRKIVPDIIFFRYNWVRFTEDEDLFRKLSHMAEYEPVYFPWKDIPFNTTAEPMRFDFEIAKHHFEPTPCDEHEYQVFILVRKGLLTQAR